MGQVDAETHIEHVAACDLCMARKQSGWCQIRTEMTSRGSSEAKVGFSLLTNGCSQVDLVSFHSFLRPCLYILRSSLGPDQQSVNGRLLWCAKQVRATQGAVGHKTAAQLETIL